MLLAFSCKAQTIIALDGPDVNYQDLPKPIMIKDQNNTRNSFFGVWQGTEGNKELTLYFYKIDDMKSESLLGNRNELFVDALFGYYIYKEDGVEIINSRIGAQTNNTSTSVKYAPFYGVTSDGENIRLYLKDYGIEIPNQNGANKRGNCDVEITNSGASTLEANFELFNQPHIRGEYNYDFSIPTNLTLTKISNTPPPLN